MKRAWNKLKRGEKGQALISVIILLVIGGLIIAPLLGFMSQRGLEVGHYTLSYLPLSLKEKKKLKL